MTVLTKDEALKLALEALEMCKAPWTGTLDYNLTEAITAIKQARAAPVQEPVATLLQQSKENFERNFGSNGYADWIYKDLADLLDTPPAAQRQWVGLTDDERIQSWFDTKMSAYEYICDIEAKLKERNT